MIKPDYEREGVQLFCGDCKELLPHIGKVDAVATDPPYGISHPCNFRERRFQNQMWEHVTLPGEIWVYWDWRGGGLGGPELAVSEREVDGGVKYVLSEKCS